MAVLLRKIVEGLPSSDGDFGHQQSILCPRCGQIYGLSYSSDEWNRVKDWANLANRAIREDHKHGHKVSSLTLAWDLVRGQ
jgi:hypothetical protein